MKNFKLLPILLFSALSWAQTADEILEKAVQALGGDQISEEIQSLVIGGEINIPPGITGKLKIYQKGEGKVYAATTIKAQGLNMEIVQACDGTDCYSNDPNMGLRLLEGQEKEMLLLQNDFMAYLDWKDLYPTREYKGQEDFEGRKVHKVFLKSEQGMTMTNYYDAENFMILKSEGTTENPLGSFTFTTVLKNYKDVFKGFKIPMVSETKLMGQTMTMTLDDVEVNVDIPEEKFKLPEGLKE